VTERAKRGILLAGIDQTEFLRPIGENQPGGTDAG
jgi:hypothetical protein